MVYGTFSLGKVCKNVKVEPHLLAIDNEVFDLRSTVTSPEARLHVKVGSVWTRGVTTFFDVPVTKVNSACNQSTINLQNRSSRSMRKRRKGSKNKKLFTWKWDLLTSWFLARTEEWGKNALFC